MEQYIPLSLKCKLSSRILENQQVLTVHVDGGGLSYTADGRGSGATGQLCVDVRPSQGLDDEVVLDDLLAEGRGGVVHHRLSYPPGDAGARYPCDAMKDLTSL